MTATIREAHPEDFEAVTSLLEELGRPRSLGTAEEAAVRDRFLPVLEEGFPDLVARYRHAYEGRSGVPPAYARALAARVKKLQARFGFPINDGMVDRYRPRHAPVQGSLDL